MCRIDWRAAMRQWATLTLCHWRWIAEATVQALIVFVWNCAREWAIINFCLWTQDNTVSLIRWLNIKNYFASFPINKMQFAPPNTELNFGFRFLRMKSNSLAHNSWSLMIAWRPAIGKSMSCCRIAVQRRWMWACSTFVIVLHSRMVEMGKERDCLLRKTQW